MAADNRRLYLLLLALGGALAAAFSQRKTIMLYGSKALEAGKEKLFELSLPSRARPYAGMILRVARETGVDPFLIFALGDRESQWGQTLKPTGPAGTGDWAPRNWGPSPMPPDGLGWGRGLMQLDYENALKVNWRDPYSNIRAGTLLFKQNLTYFSAQPKTPTVTLKDKNASRRNVQPGVYRDVRPLVGDALVRAAMAAYNTGAGNVLMNLAAGLSPDYTTTGGDYSSDVSNRMAAASTKFQSSVA